MIANTQRKSIKAAYSRNISDHSISPNELHGDIFARLFRDK